MTDTPQATATTHHATALAAENNAAALCETPGRGPEVHAVACQGFEVPLRRGREAVRENGERAA